jgi:hypothetical protein
MSGMGTRHGWSSYLVELHHVLGLALAYWVANDVDEVVATLGSGLGPICEKREA